MTEDRWVVEALKRIDEKTECLPELCRDVAVHSEQISSLKARAETESSRRWQVILAVIVSIITSAVAAVGAWMKAGGR